MTDTSTTPQTLQHPTVFLHWDRHGLMTGTVAFPAGHPHALVSLWRRRVTANNGWTAEAGTPNP